MPCQLTEIATDLKRLSEKYALTVKHDGLSPAYMGIGYWNNHSVEEIEKYLRDEVKLSDAFKYLGQLTIYVAMSDHHKNVIDMRHILVTAKWDERVGRFERRTVPVFGEW